MPSSLFERSNRAIVDKGRRIGEMVDERSDDVAGYLGWFFLGAVAGAALALLVAPQSGREMREVLTEAGGSFLKMTQGKAKEMKGGAVDNKDREGRNTGEEWSPRESTDCKKKRKNPKRCVVHAWRRGRRSSAVASAPPCNTSWTRTGETELTEPEWT
jgi:gas vesicle protein